jgi:hypothetical protein
MTFRDFRDIQELMLGIFVRNVMLLATIPYHLAREMRGNRL